MADKFITAGTPEEAVGSKNRDNVYMAGGTEIMRLGSSVTADAFVSVRNTAEMHKIEACGDMISVGASCTFQELVDCDLIPDYLRDALLFMASRTRRNMATIGGNIAVCRDDSFLIPTLIAASAALSLSGPQGSCNIAVRDYVFDHDKYEDMLITSVSFPAGGVIVRSYRSANTAQSHARLTASLAFADGKYTACAALKNSGIYMADDLAQEMGSHEMSEDEIVEFVKKKQDIHLGDDLIYGSAAYRRYLTGISFALMYADISAEIKSGKNTEGGSVR